MSLVGDMVLCLLADHQREVAERVKLPHVRYFYRVKDGAPLNTPRELAVVNRRNNRRRP